MLPMGLTEGARTRQAIKQGDVTRRLDVEQASETFVGNMRQLQESALGWNN
jgi:predicted homoserine dehydrogenase-like protein